MFESHVGGRQRPLEPIYTHSRSRTTSSNTFPVPIQSPQPTMQVHLGQPPLPSHYHASRRSPSVNTFSSLSSSGMVPPAAYRTSPTTDLQRSSSGRSGGGGHPLSSYVASLRKQKATVWSDRAQPEDPRLVAAQRAAKMRANLEVVGPSGASTISYTTSTGTMVTTRTTTGLSSAGGKVAAKIRHHGKPGVVGYAPDSNYAGVGGVPLRLSATEVEGEDSDDEDPGAAMQNRITHHRRTGSSGRSSTASGRRVAAGQPMGIVGGGPGGPGGPGGGGLAYRSSGNLGSLGGSSSGRRWSPGDTPERTGSLVDDRVASMASANSSSYPADEAGSGGSGSGRPRSIASGSSAERADSVPDLASPRQGANASKSAMNAALTREKSVKTVEELRRRGSVDERTMTLTGSAGRLFIANPD